MSKPGGPDRIKPSAKFEEGIQRVLTRALTQDYAGNAYIPSGTYYLGLKPEQVGGWDYATGDDDVHTDWDVAGFMAGGWT